MGVAQYLALQRYAVPTLLQRVRQHRIARREHGLNRGARAPGLAHLRPAPGDAELAAASGRLRGDPRRLRWGCSRHGGLDLHLLYLWLCGSADPGRNQNCSDGQDRRYALPGEETLQLEAAAALLHLVGRKLAAAAGTPVGDAQGSLAARVALLVGSPHHNCSGSCGVVEAVAVVSA